MWLHRNYQYRSFCYQFYPARDCASTVAYGIYMSDWGYYSIDVRSITWLMEMGLSSCTWEHKVTQNQRLSRDLTGHMSLAYLTTFCAYEMSYGTHTGPEPELFFDLKIRRYNHSYKGTFARQILNLLEPCDSYTFDSFHLSKQWDYFDIIEIIIPPNQHSLRISSKPLKASYKYNKK